jgi:hypothetical protein
MIYNHEVEKELLAQMRGLPFHGSNDANVGKVVVDHKPSHCHTPVVVESGM